MSAAPRRIAVVGGGIAGLSAAYELQRARAAGAPVEIDLYESDARVGGVIRSVREGDWLLDVGPDSLIRFKPAALQLCRELGIDSELITTRAETAGLSIYSRGRLRPVPIGGGGRPSKRIRRFVAGGLISWRGLARMAAEPLIPRRRAAADESLARFFERRLGREAVERLIDPLLAGIHAGDPERLSARATFPRYVEMTDRDRSLMVAMARERRRRMGDGVGGVRPTGERPAAFWSFPDGLERLVHALCAALPDTRIHVGSPVRRIDRSAGGYTIALEGGRAAEEDGVIVAVPAHAAARLLAGMDAALADALGRIRYASTATVFHAYRRRELGREPDGHGFLIPLVERRRINGATWASRKYTGRAPPDGFLARCYVGGDRTPEALALEDGELADTCRDELRRIAGIDGRPIFTRVFRFGRANPQYEVGHDGRVAAIEGAARSHPGLYLTGAGYRGLGIPDAVADARAAARRALEFGPG